ncbi:MAG: ribonuclease D [Coriobacteriales bacterium]
MDSRYIDTQAGLEQLAADLEGSAVLAVDTEFLREKTYYPKLCLIQLNNEEIQAIVDPLAVRSLEPLAAIMADPTCVKIFHSGSQDIDILYHELGVMPTPLFDTQMAAALMGFPLQVGYGPLVQALCNVRLAKADSYTDWSRRPLTTNQLKYALDDVVYLPKMYRHMERALAKQGRSSWLDADFARLADPAKYDNDPMDMWRKVKRVASLSHGQMAVAQELAAWREREAMERNIPRKWVIPDEALIEIARKSPKSIDRLMEVRGLNTKLTTKTARKVLEAVKRGREKDPKDYPCLPKRPSGSPEVDGAVDLLASVVEVRAKENGVAVPVLASRDDLARLVHGHKDDCELMQGWRYEMVGRELEAIMEGKLAVYVEGGRLCVGER